MASLFSKLVVTQLSQSREFAGIRNVIYSVGTLVGRSSQADYLMRNVAMDDSIGGS